MSDRQAGPVVVGVDGSSQSLVAVEAAIEQAVLRGTDLHVVHCADITPAILHLAGGVTVDTRELAERDHEAVWEAVAPALENAPVTVTRIDLAGYPSDELTRYCDENDAALLVVGTRGRGRVASTVLGSTSLRSLENAQCNVLVARDSATG